MLEVSRKMYVFAPYKFRKLFPGFPERVRIRFMEHTRTASEIESLLFSLQFSFRV